MIFEELSRNCDAYKLSTNLHKHRDDVDNGRFRITLWDFNLGLGNCNFSRAFETDTWSFTSTDYNHADAGVPPYWDQLVKDERFMAEVRDSWREIRKTTLSDENIIHHIDSMASLLDNSGAVLRNNAAWPTWNNYIWPNYYVSSSFADEIRFLKEWTFERIKFLDENWGSEPLFNDGYRYSIRNYSNNMKLYIDKYGEAGLSNLELGDDNEFIFERVDTTPYYKIKSSLYDLYLTKSESTAPNEYVLADQLSGDDQTKQHWMFEKLKDSYKIISRHNGHLIRTRSNGDLVSYYNVDYSADRKWHVDTEFIPSSIGSVSSENSAKIYSANSIIYISNVTQDAQITIFNLKGQTVYGGNSLSGNDYTIDMPAKETVVIIIKTAEGNVSSQKIVIN